MAASLNSELYGKMALERYVMLDILFHPAPPAHLLPSFIRAVEEVQGIRVIRLQGPVGTEIGKEEQEAETAGKAAVAFSRPLLLDFKDTTAWDSSTVAYLVRLLRRRVAAHAAIGIINAPPKLLAELEISRLRDTFPIYSSEDEALGKLANPPGA